MNAQDYRNDPTFSAFALNELSERDAQEYRESLLKEGVSAQDIDNEVANIQLLKATLQSEFSKDQVLRASSSTRSSIMAPTQKKSYKWLWNSLIGGSVSALALVLYLSEQTEHVFNQADSYSEKATVSSPRKIKLSEKKKIITNDLAASGAQRAQLNQVSNGAKPEVSFAKGSARMMKTQDLESFAPIAAAPKMIVEQEQFNREGYDKIDNNPYTLVSNEPLSTFSVDVDTASYSNMRRFLLKGQLPPKDSLRIEEMINYFPYDYKADFSNHPVAIQVDQAQSIWTKGRKIVRIAMKSDSPSQLTEASKNLVFLMDVSGSMHSPKKLPLLKESMKLLLRKLKKKDTISLVVYAGAAGVILEPTPVSEKVKILKALDKLRSGGSTNGGAGIIAAYKMAKLGFIKDGVNRVILATDGDFNVGASSRSSLIDLVEQKAKQDIFLTVVGLGMGNYQDATLEEISNRGNGNYAYIDSLQEANKLFNIDLEKNLTTVAKDVKVQVEFNPSLVKAYRLIGYENRMLAAKDFNDDKKDAGEMGAGHTVTALYEIVPQGQKFEGAPEVDKLKYSTNPVPKEGQNISDELLTVKVRYKSSTGTKSTKFEVPLKNESIEFKDADREFRFASSVATFGLKLRGDDLVEGITYRDIEKMAKDSKGVDPYDFRAEFIEMVDLASQIDK